MMKNPLANAADDPAAYSAASVRPHHHKFTVETLRHLDDVLTGLSAGDVKSHPLGRKIDRQRSQIAFDSLLWNLFGERDRRPLLHILPSRLPNMHQIEKRVARPGLLDSQRQRCKAGLVKIDGAKHRT